ncbi:hypothetical protein Dda_3335 [Drechslerella dactyloides]|uniref:DUF3492 domain-containing protein n=1 Tax=Drechslerella dactyloides TaxID=74499 RepID=A0AAD6NL51_DREDA|nr:hypothetical protein Dda_3335 [Drechslerella dactyloides]
MPVPSDEDDASFNYLCHQSDVLSCTVTKSYSCYQRSWGSLSPLSPAQNSFKMVLIFSNALVPHELRFIHWYQWASFYGSLGLMGLPLLVWFIKFAIFKLQAWKARPPRSPTSLFIKHYLASRRTQVLTKKRKKFPDQISTFGTYMGRDINDLWGRGFELLILDEEVIATLRRPRLSSIPEEAGGEAPKSVKAILCYIGKPFLGQNTSDEQKLGAVVDAVHRLLRSPDAYGLVMPADILPNPMLNELLHHCGHLSIPVFIQSMPPFTDVVGLDMTQMAGVIFENACIHPDGERRDFFQAYHLRHGLGRCARQRETRPQFFIGFHDGWQIRPRAATVRRAFKLAKFFGATLQVTPASSQSQIDEFYPAERCLSGFEWLKRDDVIQLHKDWVEEKKPICCDDKGHYEVSRLDTDTLSTIIPGLAQYIQLFDVQDEGHREGPALEPISATNYNLEAPRRQNFWTMSSLNDLLCPLGCYDIGEEILQDHFNAIQTSQEHLRDINMLEVVAEAELHNDKLHLFVSLKAPDFLGTTLHAYLATTGVPREERFYYEIDLARSTNPDLPEDTLPPRVLAELNNATYAEQLTLLSQIQAADNPKNSVMVGVEKRCHELLIQDATRLAWKEVHARYLLKGDMGIYDVLGIRLNWYRRQGANLLPCRRRLEQMFEIIDAIVADALFNDDEDTISTITEGLTHAFGRTNTRFSQVDVLSDLFALMVFSAFRKYGFEEVYLEATDRCPLFHHQKDQASVFAEQSVLGYQCEIYFDVTPRVLGELIYDRYREYLRAHPPPANSWDDGDLFTAYSKVEYVPESETGGEKVKPLRRPSNQLSAMEDAKTYSHLSTFYLLGIIDILLLTFLGRGLYLTSFMREVEVLMASFALLTALLMGAGVTGWFAFDSMNHFFVSRLAGGFMLSSVVSICAFLAFGFQYGWYPAAIFVAYFNFLSPYLNLIGILATTHHDAAPLQSGRKVLAKSMVILLLSPIITTFVNGHDIVIYLPICYTSLFVLLYNYRKLCINWATWLDKIVIIDDNKILEWWADEYSGGDQSAVPKDDEGSRSTLLEVARALLLKRIRAADSKKHGVVTGFFPVQETHFVKQLAEGYRESVWLLEKDALGAAIPEPYTSTWNMQLKVALNSQRLFVRGLKEHSPFQMWRYSKYDVAQNVTLFIIALLDRWVAIAMSANGFVGNLYIEFRARYGIAFGLLYFLSGAIALDSHVQRYRGAMTKKSKEKLKGERALHKALSADIARKRMMYYKAFWELSLYLAFLFGICTMIMWLFVYDTEQTVLYFGYCYGYAGVLIMQFNRVFTRSIKKCNWAMIISALIGFFTGVALHLVPSLRSSRFNDIIALATAATLGVISSYYLTDFSPQPKQKANDDADNGEKTNRELYLQKYLGLTLDEPCVKPKSIELLSDEFEHIRYHPGHNISDQIEKILTTRKPSIELRKAFPALSSYQSQAYIRWRTGTSNIYLTTISGMRKLGSQHSMAVGIVRDIHLDVYTSVPGAMPYFVQEDQVDLIAQVLAGALLHETCEAVFSLSHADAALAETCLLDSEDSLLSRRMRLQLGFSDHRSLAKICERTNVELLRHLTFDQPVNQNWVNLPEDVREMIVAHVENRDFLPTLDVVNWMGTITREPWRLRVERMKLRVRQCLAIHGMANKSISRIAGTRPISYISRAAFVLPDLPPTDNLELMQINKPPKTGFVASCKRWGSSFYYFLVALAKYAAITSGAGYDMGRELGHALRNKWYRMPVLTVVLFCWRACRRVKKFAITIFLFHHRPVITKLLKVAKYGIPRILTARTIIVDDPQNPMTGFLTRDSITIRCEIYAGILTQPGDKKSWRGSCEYDTSQRLRSLKTGAVDRPVKTTYEYESSKHIRHPIRKTVLKDNRIDKIYYDAQGRQSHGSLFAGDREWYFEYLYCATPPNSREILKARYTSLDPNYTAIYSVYWCIVPLREDGNPQTWKPYDKITRLVYTFNERSWDVTWTYAHPRHPTLSTVFLERDEIRFQDQPPREALQDVYGFYKKPKDLGFESEDMLFFHPPSRIGSRFAASLGRSKPSFFSFSKQKVVYGPINTAKLRTILWQQWASAENLDAVSACYIDELILREEPLLREYWTLRDRGHFKRANQYIRQNINIIAATIEITDDVSQNTWLSIKVGDLLTMGGAKDATHLTLRPEDCYQDTYDKLSVTFLDTGCWPDAPGGVSACRRDLVNGHTTIRNHVLVESASDYGVPRHQIERNVNSMQVIPLWGLEGRTPNHGLFDNLLDTQVENRIRDTDIKEDVVGTFIPLLKTLIKGARQVRYSNEDLVTYTNVILNMSKYFEEKDYNKSWRAKETLEAWRQAWMTEDDDANINNPSTFLKIEMPSLFDFDSALELFICYFFVYHCRIPDAPPTVFQSTHHGIGSLYGMILKLRRGVTWGIWDHGLMWRENCLNISTAQCQLAIPVQNMLLGMMKLAANLAYFHADVLLPSTSVYSPDWEVELGTDAGLRQSRKEFRRKIDPVANGTDDMGSLQPVTESISSEPTVVMLSNAQAIKDIKNAIRAADVIINTFGFKNYHLAIYDAIDRVPAHTVEILKIIASRGLTGLVKLGGLGSPKTALKGAWLFMNSSSSEDLPRVIGEAALNGIPIAATEAGAAARVLVDPDDPDARYGEVVPPNDPVALARAQLSLLAMLGPWAKYTEDAVQPPPLPETFTPEDREWISRRMYEKADDRRKLGLRLREVVPRSFHNERYLREHEQMYWAQSFRSKQRRDPALTALAARQNRLGRTCSMRVEERTELYSMWEREGRWQDFDEPENRWSKWQEGNAAKSERRKAMSWLGGEEV